MLKVLSHKNHPAHLSSGNKDITVQLVKLIAFCNLQAATELQRLKQT